MDSTPILGGAAQVITAAAAVAGGLYLLGLLLKIVRRVDAIGHVVRRELAGDTGDGSTMKEDLHGMAVAIGQLQKDRAADRGLIDLALRRLLHDHPADLELLDAVIRRERTNR